MPSLRRASSTPSVRASPYSTTTHPGSRSHLHHHHYHHRLHYHPHLHGGSGGGYHRRPSGSAVSARKVLADIDWWRVADGQREQGGEGDEEEDEEGEEERDVGGDEANPVPSVVADPADPEAGVAAAATSNLARDAIPVTDRTGDGGNDDDESVGAEPAPAPAPERPSTPVASESPVHHLTLAYSPQSYLFGQLASFAAAGPRTPTRRTVSESSVSSVSSLESSPEVLRTPIERLSFAGMGFADPGLDMPLFHMRLASLDTIPLAVVPKHLFPERGGLDNSILADPLMSHDDLFA